jgi:hypothetical protein
VAYSRYIFVRFRIGIFVFHSLLKSDRMKSDDEHKCGCTVMAVLTDIDHYFMVTKVTSVLCLLW